MKDLRRVLALGLLVLAGCNFEPAPVDTIAELDAPQIGASFDRSRTGTITGRITWKGPIPSAPDFLYGAPRADGGGFEFRKAKNPNQPRVNPETRAVKDAVVFLRGIDAARGKPWDLPEVEVTVIDSQFEIAQGARRGNAGFVRRGTAASFLSKDAGYNVVRGRGAAFFGATLPERDRPTRRTLSAPGLVELSSGNGLYWSRAYLFVADHPYFTVSDANGEFTLDFVPAGELELVVWLPNWAVEKQERDADSTIIVRQAYGPPLERIRPVAIVPGASSELPISLP